MWEKYKFKTVVLSGSSELLALTEVNGKRKGTLIFIYQPMQNIYILIHYYVLSNHLIL